MGTVVAVNFKPRFASGPEQAIMARNAPAFLAPAGRNHILVNARCARLVGEVRETISTDDWFSAISAAERLEVTGRWRDAVNRRKPFSLSWTLQSLSSRTILAQAFPVYCEEGEYLGHSGWLVDTTGRQLSRTEIANSMLLLSDRLRSENRKQRLQRVSATDNTVVRSVRILAP